MSKSMTAVEKIKAHLAGRGEEGMEAAQVILILVLVVIGLVPVLIMIKNSLAERADQVDKSINSDQWN